MIRRTQIIKELELSIVPNLDIGVGRQDLIDTICSSVGLPNKACICDCQSCDNSCASNPLLFGRIGWRRRTIGNAFVCRGRSGRNLLITSIGGHDVLYNERDPKTILGMVSGYLSVDMTALEMCCCVLVSSGKANRWLPTNANLILRESSRQRIFQRS